MEKQTTNDTQTGVKSIPDILRSLKIGESVNFPNTKYSPAQTAKTRISIECDFILVTHYNREEKVLTITRNA